MKTILYRSETRGHEDYGWLETKHTFSFANYYDPNRIHFGALRVVNDDIIEGGRGFDIHPHLNMEIITIPISGKLKHKDSLGHEGIINAGDVQIMSAGTGIKHSEYNADPTAKVNILQIWILPNKKNVEPRYQQVSYDFVNTKNAMLQIVSPSFEETPLWIHQNAWLSIGSFDKNKKTTYQLKDSSSNGVFIMVIDGTIKTEGIELRKRDSIGISETELINIESLSDSSRLLIIEVPMHI